jgi:hypothetical protein
MWQTDDVPRRFVVEYGRKNESPKTAIPKMIPLSAEGKKYRLYQAELGPLQFDKEYHYTLIADHKACFLGQFRTRTQGSSFRCVLIGDSGEGTAAQLRVSRQMDLQKPDFVLHMGDFAYGRGLISNALRHHFPYDNGSKGSSGSGVPFMQKIPFYLTFGNHDVSFEARDLDKTPGALAAFYYFALPLNGPTVRDVFEVKGGQEKIDAFKEAVGEKSPKMLNYSFDWGNAHFVVLDGNRYTHPLDTSRLEWLRSDLQKSKAQWKFVAVHQAPFCTKDRYKHQGFRLLAKTFEEAGVDMVFSGHMHNYQRAKPLHFTPDSMKHRSPVGEVKGKFRIDRVFDGKKATRPKGVIYIVTGAGGALLYDRGTTFQPNIWEPFTAQYIGDRHSLTSLKVRGKKLSLKQVDENGQVVDQITIEK